MFVTDKLLYLQLQKTGCTHIVKMMDELVGGQSVGKKHGRLSADFAVNGRRIVGSIRNPWSWYVSLWAFGCTHNGAIYLSTTGRNLQKRFTGPDRYSREWLSGVWSALTKPTWRWRRLYADSADPALFRQWLKMVFDPRRAGDLGQDYGKSPICEFGGLLTYRYLWLYSSDPSALFAAGRVRDLPTLQAHDAKNNLVELVIRTESLEADLIGVLKAVGHDVNGAAESKLRGATRTNTSNHRPTRDYYDDETIDLVARKEAFIIAKYGYQPPGRAR